MGASKYSSNFLKRFAPALLIAAFTALGIFVIWGIWRAAFPPPPPMQGQMEARVINVSSKTPGRVGAVLAREGDFVREGQPVALMHLPELEAKLSQAIAQEHAAKAKESLVDEGARPQEKEAARAEWQRAEADAVLAGKTWRRIAALYADGLVSRQKRDEAEAKMLAAVNQAKAAREAYEITVIGPRKQEKSMAGDESSEAEAGVSQVEAVVSDRELVAPRAGQVDKVLLVSGEMAGAGFPILTIVHLEDQWAVFNIREEHMPGIKIGTVLRANIPALALENVDFSVYYISPRASYATWRSTRENSGYDMKTFEVRARPTHMPEGLRPGMSVLVAR